MICYKCDMCGIIHINIGEMNNLEITYAGEANVNYPKNGKFHICLACTAKILNELHAFSETTDEEKEEC